MVTFIVSKTVLLLLLLSISLQGTFELNQQDLRLQLDQMTHFQENQPEKCGSEGESPFLFHRIRKQCGIEVLTTKLEFS